MKNVAVIMAGGRGERFWPKSRLSCPKQFLSLTSDCETMIQKTVARLAGFIGVEDIFVVTNESYLDIVSAQLPELPRENVLAEPIERNTAPCIGLAAEVIKRRYGEDTTMVVLPSDHLIKFNQMFIDTLKQAINVAQIGKNLVTIGVAPTCPETGYGYIQFSESDLGIPLVYGVKRFVEKPNLELAKEYVSAGEYFWNSGIFVWKTSSILQSIETLLSDMYKALESIAQSMGKPEFDSVLHSVYQTLQPESIDYGVMEHANNIYTVPGNFGWDDVGNWRAVERINKTNEYGNMVKGDVISINTKNSTVLGGKKLIATVGVSDLIVVDTPDALLICGKHSTQDVKKVIENLKICNRTELI